MKSRTGRLLLYIIRDREKNELARKHYIFTVHIDILYKCIIYGVLWARSRSGFMYRPPKGQSRLSIKTSVFSSLLEGGGGRLHRQRHCRGAAHKLNLRRTTTRGKTRKIYRHSWHRNYLRSAITYCEVFRPPRNRPGPVLVYIFVCTSVYIYV